MKGWILLNLTIISLSWFKLINSSIMPNQGRITSLRNKFSSTDQNDINELKCVVLTLHKGQFRGFVYEDKALKERLGMIVPARKCKNLSRTQYWSLLPERHTNYYMDGLLKWQDEPNPLKSVCIGDNAYFQFFPM